MLVRKWRSKPDIVTITVTIASVENHKPIIGFTDEVEKSWRSLQKKHQLKEKKIGDKGLLKSSSSDLLDDHVQTTVSAEKLSKSTSVDVNYHIIRSDRGHYQWNRVQEPIKADPLIVKL